MLDKEGFFKGSASGLLKRNHVRFQPLQSDVLARVVRDKLRHPVVPVLV
jgi:hypothetical protein